MSGVEGDVQRRVESELEALAQDAVDGTLSAMFTCYSIGVATRMLAPMPRSRSHARRGPVADV